MYLFGEVVGEKDLKFGPTVDEAKGGCVETLLLVCSQQ
jgi:hypothetical protein